MPLRGGGGNSFQCLVSGFNPLALEKWQIPKKNKVLQSRAPDEASKTVCSFGT